MARELNVWPFLGGIVKALLSDDREKVEGHSLLFILRANLSKNSKPFEKRLPISSKNCTNCVRVFGEECFLSLQERVNKKESLLSFYTDCTSLIDLTL